MKKLYKLCVIPFIPLITGILLVMFGNEKLAHIGSLILSIGMPITMVLLVMIALILMMTGRLQDKPKDTPAEDEQQMSGWEKEQAQIEDVNSSYGYQSRYKQGEYMMNHTAEIYKMSSVKEKILGWLFFGLLMADFMLILVFAFLGIWTGTIICFCLFGGTILICAIGKVILEKSSKHISKNKLALLPKYEGEVKACVLSSMSSFGERTTRISHVTYRVIIESEGKIYNAYSDNFYETGETVKFLAKGKRATILPPENEE